MSLLRMFISVLSVTRGGKLQSPGQIYWPLAFVNSAVLEDSHSLSSTCCPWLDLQQQGWRVAAEALWSTQVKRVFIWLFIENLWQLCCIVIKYMKCTNHLERKFNLNYAVVIMNDPKTLIHFLKFLVIILALFIQWATEQNLSWFR